MCSTRYKDRIRHARDLLGEKYLCKVKGRGQGKADLTPGKKRKESKLCNNSLRLQLFKEVSGRAKVTH